MCWSAGGRSWGRKGCEKGGRRERAAERRQRKEREDDLLRRRGAESGKKRKEKESEGKLESSVKCRAGERRAGSPEVSEGAPAPPGALRGEE